MLRIIAGQWRGRALKTPQDARARPTLGRVREAVFSMLGEMVEGARALDLFAGTGALGFEALSRGARSCVFVDSSCRHLALIRENAARLGCAERVTVAQGTLPNILRSAGARAIGKSQGEFDVALVDPPSEGGLAGPTLDVLAERRWLADGAVVMIETRRGEELACPGGFELIRDKRYGDTQVRFLRWTTADGARMARTESEMPDAT